MDKRTDQTKTDKSADRSSQPPVFWNLSDDDKQFLRSCNIAPG